ncbi:hypothetical protein VitviT2T_029127 [Vitis vinifera]|uniref:Terpene synthase N-terminal domain-containing protein n=1 Tax=Vitis vinifera TaxID=29760 RepID=A0ABY9DV89_VITVI|nr:hypothetical protein VitviT2T_029127 [Vitis vinifera]
MSTDHSAPNANPETNRPTPNYHPSIWGNRFIMTNTPDDEGDFVISITLAHEEQQLEDLKQEVRRELIAAASNLSQQLKFIDAVQRLGLAYHFEKEIEEALQHTYDNYHEIDDINDDLYNVAL